MTLSQYPHAIRAACIVVGLLLPGCGKVLSKTSDAGMTSDAALANCSTLPQTCGPNGDLSCCTSSLVPGGMFYRGYDTAAGTIFTEMMHPAMLSAFRLDSYEITVGRFRQFIAAKQGTQANPPPLNAGARTLNGAAGQGGWDSSWNVNLAATQAALFGALHCDRFATWTDVEGPNENYPILCITWYEALAFCAWDGGFLPTEAESMFAASGGDQQRAYPWSNPANSLAIDCAKANFGGTNWPQTACVKEGAQAVGKTIPAGDGLFGQADLGGNAFEWVLDWSKVDASSSCNDCANLVPRTDRVIRGGSFLDDPSAARAASRSYGLPPDARASFLGARCARAPGP